MEDTPTQPTVFDTDQQLLGDVYAKALMGFAQQSGQVDQFVDELSGVVGVLDEIPKLKIALESPRIPFEAKTKMLDTAFQGKVSQEMVNFLKIVATKRRFDCLGAMASSARRMQDDMAGRVQATLTTAEEVEDSVREKISDRLSGVLGKQVNLSTAVDPEIIGGMVIRVGDTVYDASVANQLNQVRAKAVKRAADAIREKLDRFASA
jgi:F-type H+-transporting ATPase subunit delta